MAIQRENNHEMMIKLYSSFRTHWNSFSKFQNAAEPFSSATKISSSVTVILQESTPQSEIKWGQAVNYKQSVFDNTVINCGKSLKVTCFLPST